MTSHPPTSDRSETTRGGKGRAFAASAVVAALAASSFAVGVLPATAAVSTDAPVVISEVYGGGGNNGAVLNRDFIELLNTSDVAVDLDGWSVQYASASGTSWQVTPLGDISLEAGAHLLVGQAFGTNTGLPGFEADVDGSIPMQASNAKVALVDSITALAAGTGVAALPQVIDYVGYGSANDFAVAPAPATSVTQSASRDAAGTNTGNNSADFALGAPTPTSSGTGTTPTPEPTTTTSPSPSPSPSQPTTPGTVVPIAEIQGTGAASPLAGQTVTTEGVVTAHYPTGGFNGYVIQTAGTGGSLDLATHTASDAIFVYSPAAADAVALGDTVRVTGPVSEFNGLTQITAGVGAASKIDAATAPTSSTVAWPTTDAQRESLESMLVQLTDEFTVSNTYSTNQYGEVGLAVGSTPLRQPTDAARPGTPEAAAVADDNAARALTVDDGASTNFLNVSNSTLTPAYVSLLEPVVVGGQAELSGSFIVDYRNNTWKINPTQPLVADGSGTDQVAFSNPRTEAPQPVGGDLSVASFNVLNYFTTLGETTAGCQTYTPLPNGQANSVRTGCDVRGAWDAADFARQQSKIVTAIEDLDASVVGLMEIENSEALGETKDEAVGSLVAALNAASTPGKWAFVPTADSLADVDRDVITNAIIYQTALVEPEGASVALATQSGNGQAFANAREPIGQFFTPADGGEKFFVAVNHFKSKGSGEGVDADQNDGQGASNNSRVRQATALTAWVDEVTTDEDAVFLVGDFNSYTQEDPMQVLYGAGYVNAESEFELDSSSYSFSGLSGSLDHVLLNEVALQRATGADIWNINSGESIALEYSRYGYHGTNFWEDGTPYRSSDHDPVKVGLSASATAPIELTLLGINDFHGRIDSNTVKFAGTIEQLRDQARGESLFLSAGDNIGASLFASSYFDDEPTIEVLNALDLETSAVGNHEFDKGFDDLSGRVEESADFSYLGANVYEKGTTDPALQEYQLIEVDGLTVAVVGAITEETSTLVSPGGIADLEFGDPVEAVNRVAGQLSDGDSANGEADVIIAMYHEGAAGGVVEGTSLEEELADSPVFASIVNDTSAKVDAIYTGHTHKEYAWSAPVPGVEGATRPIVQTGSYGAKIGKIVLTLDAETGDLISHTEENVARTTADDAALVSQYPRVAEVKEIVDLTLAAAAEVGNTKVGEVSGDITTAFGGGSFVDGVWAGGSRDDRASESALGNLVAGALRDSMADLPNGAQIGVTNSGGLRADLWDTQAEFGANAVAGLADGDISFSQALAVLPFNNTTTLVTMTGEQFTDLLEQQWQRAADGTVPSRAYLQLGLSENVTYTFDATLPEGSRITSVTVDGAPIDPAADYRIGTLSFLADGGDNFREFAEATDRQDTGNVDYQAWVDFLAAESPVAAPYAKHAVSVKGAPESAAAGSNLAFQVSTLNMTSRGTPEARELTVSLGDEVLGTFPIVGGAADVAITLPADAAEGAASLTLTTDVAGTVVTLPVTITAAGSGNPGTGEPGTEAPNGSWATVTLNDRVEQGGVLNVTVTGLKPGQLIGATLFSEPIVVTGIPVADASGRTSFSVAIPSDFALGAHELVVTSAGESPIRVGVTVLAGGQLAVTGSELPLGIALAAGFLLVAGGLTYALRRRSPVTR